MAMLWNSLACLLLIFISTTTSQTTSLSGFFRIEVEFGQLENTQGRQANGQFCDEVTACDPVIYTHIDVEKPLSRWPKQLPTEQTMLTWKRNVNSYEVNQTISKDICGGGLSNVNTRVEVQDEDFFGKYDMIEQFECTFFPSIVERSNRHSRPAEFQQWSSMTECLANYRPAEIRLFFRWRVYTIPAADCGDGMKTPKVAVQRPTMATIADDV